MDRPSAELLVAYPATPFDGAPSENGGDGDWRCVCFVCGRTADRGEALICVARRLERLPVREGKTEVIEAVATLQACWQCTQLSAHREFGWVHKPRLTDLELGGFYTYARLLAGAVARTRSDTRVRRVSDLGSVADASHAPVAQDATSLLGGRYNASPIIVTAGDCCRYCLNVVDVDKPYLVIEASVDRPGRCGVTQSSVLQLGRYCNECRKRLFPVICPDFD